ncbi:hypothetical protein M569_09666, partial [Genlisea aurea]
AAKTLDSSLWWEPFKDFITELENAAVASNFTESLVMLDYYTERQCLLKCTRQIFAEALYFRSQPKSGAAVSDEAHSLVSDGVDGKLLSVLEDLSSSNFPVHMDVDLSILWSEETLTEAKLILEILFLAYYDSFSTCESKCWKRLCVLYERISSRSYHIQKLAVSSEAICSISHVKVQLLLVLIESLNLETLLQMLHDNVPFSQGSIGFSEADVLQMDITVSSLNSFDASEMGPLILSWAVFLSLLCSLPGKEEITSMMELDNDGYSRQAFEASSLEYFHEILDSDVLKDSEGPVAGYRSVLRTFISAVVASYEINVKFGDENFKLILKVLTKIYRGEESLCVQFWDRDSFIDGPVRCLLCSLEVEFPFQTIEFISLLSALCEGEWPSKCVYNFLDKSVGLSTPFKMSDGSILDEVANVVESRVCLPIPGVESLVIPSKTRGLVLRMIDKDFALVRWEGVCYSIMVAWNFFHEEAYAVGLQENYIRVDVVEIICILVKSLYPSLSGTISMSKGIQILARMLTCGSWLLSGRLAKMFLIDCEESDCSLTLSGILMELTINLLNIGSQNDIVLALVVFSLQYVLINHEFWKYKVNHDRWKVTLKVFDVMKKCVSSRPNCPKLWQSVSDILLYDSSIHSALLRIICTTTATLENLFVSRLFDTRDIEGLHLCVSSGLDVGLPSTPVFLGAILSPLTKPVPVLTAALSLISYFRNPVIQLRGAKLLSVLFVSDYVQDSICSNANLGLNDMQVTSFRRSICRILSEQSPWNENLIIAVLKLLSAAASNQPAFINSVFLYDGESNIESQDPNSERQPSKGAQGPFESKKDCILSVVLQYMAKFEDLHHRKPEVLLCILYFLRELWRGAPKFFKILEVLRGSDGFWNRLTYSVIATSSAADHLSDKLNETERQKIAYRYQILSCTLDVLSYEVFLHKKLMHAKLFAKRISKLPSDETERTEDSKVTADLNLNTLKEILSSWYDVSTMSNLINACTSWEYDRSTRYPVASVLFAVQMIQKVRAGEFGSLSVSLIDTMKSLASKESENLILSDLFYHIRGELEGRDIDSKPFKELMKFLVDLNFLDAYKRIQDDTILSGMKDVYLYDTDRLRTDLGFEMWDLLGWKESKDVGETLLLLLQQENSEILRSKSVFWALSGLIALLHMNEAEVKIGDSLTTLKLPEDVVLSSIDRICSRLQKTANSIMLNFEVLRDVGDTLDAQAELLLLLLRNVKTRIAPSSIVIVLKTSGYCLEVLCGCCSPSFSTGTTVENLLMLIITSAQIESAEGSVGASSSSLALLPILCGWITQPGYLALSLAAIDLISKGFSTPSAWFPILQRHLPLQFMIHKLQDVSSSKVVSVILKFLLNISRVRQGAEMLLNGGILEYLRLLISNFSDTDERRSPLAAASDENSNPRQSWGLSLAVLAAIIQSTSGAGSSSATTTMVDHVMASILIDKAAMVSHHLRIPDFSKQGTISLRDLKETQHALFLICVLSRDWNSWRRALQGSSIESELREKCIHLLAFIAKAAAHRPGGSEESTEALLLFRPSSNKEESELHEKPPFIESGNGWFGLSASRNGTRFSDSISTEMYNIGFLALKFLCTQAESAAKKAEELGFVDLARFPEIPMPDILHGLQEQGMAIVTELCGGGGKKSEDLSPEKREVCLLLSHVTVMALHLELCVIQICGIRPVLGRLELLSKELKPFFKATEGFGFLQEALKEMKQIVSLIHQD